MMSLTFGLFTQVSDSGTQGLLVPNEFKTFLMRSFFRVDSVISKVGGRGRGLGPVKHV